MALVLLLLYLIILPITGMLAKVKSPDYSIALGIAIESYPYPYPVRFLSLEIEKQPIRMAYLDVQPTGAGNGREQRVTDLKEVKTASMEGDGRISGATRGNRQLGSRMNQ